MPRIHSKSGAHAYILVRQPIGTSQLNKKCILKSLCRGKGLSFGLGNSGTDGRAARVVVESGAHAVSAPRIVARIEAEVSIVSVTTITRLRKVMLVVLARTVGARSAGLGRGAEIPFL